MTKFGLLSLKGFKELDPRLSRSLPAFGTQDDPAMPFIWAGCFLPSPHFVSLIQPWWYTERGKSFYFSTYRSESTRIKSSRDERVTEPAKQLCLCDSSRSHSRRCNWGKRKTRLGMDTPGLPPSERDKLLLVSVSLTMQRPWMAQDEQVSLLKSNVFFFASSMVLK